MKSRHRPNVFAWLLKWAFILAAFVFLAVTAYLAVMDAVSPGDRTTPRLSTEALRKLSPGELSDANAAEQRAFAANPLDARSVSQLSRIAEVRGDEESATRLKLIAGDMRPRVLSIQAESITILLQRRDFDGAMTKLDGLIRARPRQQSTLFAAVAGIAADPEGRSAVVRKLAADPPWRRQFFESTISSKNPQLAEQLLSELRAEGRASRKDELALLIAHYLKDNNVADAYGAWLSSLSAKQLERVKLLYDGGFGDDIGNLRFDWTVQPARGLTYRLFPRNTSSMDLTLQLDFLDFEGDFKNLSQILVLRPGRYRLTGETRFEGFQSPAGLVFRVQCLHEGRLIPLDETRPLPQSDQWITFEKTFTVPDTNCADQLLTLEGRKSSAAAGLMRGQISLDNLAIDRLPDLAQ